MDTGQGQTNNNNNNNNTGCNGMYIPIIPGLRKEAGVQDQTGLQENLSQKKKFQDC